MNIFFKIKVFVFYDVFLVFFFVLVLMLFIFLNFFVLWSMNIFFICRILFFMFKIYYKQIVSSRMMCQMLDGIRVNLRQVLRKQKDEMGYNIVVLRVVGMQIEERSVKGFVDENWEEEEKQKKEVRKRVFVSFFQIW